MMRDPCCCMVCGSSAEPYFKKDFQGAFGLTEAEYWRCTACGFGYSKTHYEMSPQRWQELNEQYHAAYQGKDENADDPNWRTRLAAQSDVIAQLQSAGALRAERPWLDWGAGDGSLSQLLAGQGLTLSNFDKFMALDGYCTESELRPGSFDFVITTSVFEHVMDLSTLDGIESLVSGAGVFGLHTLVRGSFAKDPDWFYLLPVHVSFFTNASMEVLFKRWGFKSSLYHLPSRLWFFFRDARIDVERLAAKLNPAAGEQLFFAKRGAFMDYWQG